MQVSVSITTTKLKVSYMLIFLNNINMFSKTFNKYLKYFRKVFIRLIKANLKQKQRL